MSLANGKSVYSVAVVAFLLSLRGRGFFCCRCGGAFFFCCRYGGVLLTSVNINESFAVKGSETCIPVLRRCCERAPPTTLKTGRVLLNHRVRRSRLQGRRNRHVREPFPSQRVKSQNPEMVKASRGRPTVEGAHRAFLTLDGGPRTGLVGRMEGGRAAGSNPVVLGTTWHFSIQELCLKRSCLNRKHAGAMSPTSTFLQHACALEPRNAG